MHIGKRLLVKHNEKVMEGIVIKMYEEDLDFQLESGEVIRRKFWETRKVIDEKK